MYDGILTSILSSVVREGSTITNSEDHLETSTGDHDFGRYMRILFCFK